MNTNMSNTTPLFKYNSLLVAEALRVVARKKGRPDYPGIICREVCQAIKVNQPHELKTEVMGVLYHSAEVIPSFEDGPGAGAKVTKAKLAAGRLYTRADNEKIAFINEWCNKKHGAVTMLGKRLGLNFNSIRRRLDKLCGFKPGELDQAYEYVKEKVDQATAGVNSTLGTIETERYFSVLLQIYVKGMVSLAYNDIAKYKARSPETRLYNVGNEFIYVGGINHLYSTYLRCLHLDNLTEMGLVIQKPNPPRGGSRGYILADLDLARQLYISAFEAVKPLVESGVKSRIMFSKTVPGIQIANSLYPVAFEHYEISQQSREFLI